MSTPSRDWAISIAFSIVLLLFLGLGLVWLNIERVDTAYDLNKMQRQLETMETLVAKLEVERNTLITPSRLREMARQYGLGPARPGQIRRVGPSGLVEGSSSPAARQESSPAGTTGHAARSGRAKGTREP